MKQFILLIIACIISFSIKAQILKTWDGGGGDNLWNNAANWQPNGVPRSDSVVLDNRHIKRSYQVVFPDVALRFAVRNLVMDAETGSGWQIELVLPNTNFADSAVRIGSLKLYDGTTFRNSGRGLGLTQLYVSGDFMLKKDAEYIHNSESTHDFSRANLEEGTLRFNIPFDTYRIDLTCPTAIKKIVLDGSANLTGVGYTIRNTMSLIGTFVITESARFTNYNPMLSVVNLVVDGILNLVGAVDLQTVEFEPGVYPWAANHTATFSGNGEIWLAAGKYIRFEIEGEGDTLVMQRDLALNDTVKHSFLVSRNSVLDPGLHIISGDGIFNMGGGGTMLIRLQDGIWQSAPLGHVQTRWRHYSVSSIYVYVGNGIQHTGDGVYPGVGTLVVNKPSGNLLLSKSTIVWDHLKLLKGKLITSASKLLTFEGDNNFGSAENLYNDHYGWEQSFVDGPMAIVFREPAVVRVFPIGKGNVFAPVMMMKRNTGFVTYTAEYFNTVTPTVTAVEPPLHHISRIEHWTVRSNATSTATNPADDANLWLTWRPASRIGLSVADRRNLRVARFENSGSRLRWEMQNTSSPPASPSGLPNDYTIFLQTLFTDFSPEYFTLASLTAANPMTPIDVLPVVKTTRPAVESNAILYPNPVTSVLQVQVSATAIEIINPAGQLVKKQIVRAGSKINVDMSGLPGGTYFLRVFNNGKAAIYPFVKQ